MKLILATLLILSLQAQATTVCIIDYCIDCEILDADECRKTLREWHNDDFYIITDEVFLSFERP